MKKASALLAMQLAEKLLQERGIVSLPVDIFAIAAAEGITVQAKPDTAAGVSGMLMRVGSSFGILYATHIPNKGYQNFSVGHELGHYFLPGHIDAVLPAGVDVHVSRAGFVSDDPYEIEADHFAAGFLMPDQLFRKALLRAEDGLAGIEDLAGQCRTSLTATAIRYAEKTTIPAAIVVSEGQRIDYCFMSQPLKDFRGLGWLKKGSALPAAGLTGKFNREPRNIIEGARDEDTADLQDWFGGERSVEVLEQVIGLGAYGKTLTVITCEISAEEAEEEKDLEDRWRPHFR